MREYLIKRILLIIPTLLGISIAIFLLLQFVPGGPVEQAIMKIRGLSQEGGIVAEQKEAVTKEEFEYIKKHYGFDKPIHIRYFKWLKKMARFDFGESYFYQEPVINIIKERFPVSLTFGIVSFILSYLICIPLGIFKALKHKERFDNISSILIFAGYAIPGFALGVFLLQFLAGGEFLNIFPISGAFSDNYEEFSFFHRLFDFIHHMILPLICYIIGHFAVLTILMKNSLMEELGKDYIKTALSKGLPYRMVVFKHGLRNALIPIATGFGRILSLLFAGSILIETVFEIPGIGLLSYESLINRDYPMVMGLITIQAFLALIGRLLSDVSYVVIDPRISFNK